MPNLQVLASVFGLVPALIVCLNGVGAPQARSAATARRRLAGG